MAIANQEMIRDNNRRLVLEYIVNNPPISRAALAKELHLTKATISNIVQELMDPVSYTHLMLVHHRESPVSVLNHHILDIVRKVVGLKGYQIVLLHNVFYGDTLVDESCHCKSIQGRADDHTVIFHGCILDIIRHLSTVADNDAAHVLADGTQTVSYTHLDVYKRQSPF